MLEELRKELHGLTAAAIDIDFSKLSDPEVVAKSQELDIAVSKKQHEIYEAYKRGQKHT